MDSLPELRKKALQMLPPLDKVASDKLIHELQVHQIELEMQNEELRTTNRQLEIANAKYTELYEFSPIGFITLGPEGKIESVNLTYTMMINLDRSSIIGQHFVKFVAPDDQDRWTLFFRNIKTSPVSAIEVKLSVVTDVRALIQCVTDTSTSLTTDINFALTNITSQCLREAKAVKESQHDVLTGLPNRYLLFDRIDQEMLNSHRHKHYSAVLFADIDKLKKVNDDYGHEAGDVLLIEIAKRLLESVRDTDTVSRLGGDEFVIIAGNVGPTIEMAKSQALDIAKKITVSISTPINLLNNNLETEYIPAISIGVVIFNGSSNTASQLLKIADTAMYNSKKSSRVQILISSPVGEMAIGTIRMERECASNASP
jgi:diguanylate cyclase (GGDEF)-like protein